MIKMTMICSAHAIHRFLRNILIALFILFLALFVWLLVGIQVNTLKVGDYHINELYIKLDKKLTLKANNITLPQRKEKPSFDNVDKIFTQIKHLLSYFESIDLKNVHFENNKLDIMFVDDVLYITSNDYEIAGNVHKVGETLVADISLLYLKKDNVHITGKLSYDLSNHMLKTEGDFTAYDIQGKFSANKKDAEIDFSLESETFSNLMPLIDSFSLEEGLRSWIVEKVEAKDYKLLSIQGKGMIEKGEFILDVNALKGEMLLSDVKIHFKENLAPILTSSFLLRYQGGEVYFDLKDPSFEGLSLKGSEVSVLNLLNENTNVKLKMRINTHFDTRFQHLLKAYDIVLPIDEKSASVDVLFMADIGLKSAYQDFSVDVNFTRGNIWLKNIKLPIVKGSLQYQNAIITLKDIVLKDTQFEGKVNGNINLASKNAVLDFNATRIELGNKEETFFILKNESIPVSINYKNNTKISIEKFSLTLLNKPNYTTINIRNFKKIKPYLAEIGPLKEDGNIELRTKDFKSYFFKGSLNISSCFLYEKKDQCKTIVPFEGTASPKDLDFFAFNKRFHYNKDKSRIKLNKLNINLDKFLKIENKELKKPKSKSLKKKKGTALVILGKNSHLRYKYYRLLMDSYDVEVKKNGDIKAMGSAAGDIIKFSMKKDILTMQAFRIKDKILHPMINFNGLYNGRYSIKTFGNPEKSMKGHIIVEGGVMKGFEAYNNTLAFINTLPALAVLQKPGYSREGFNINEGVVKYRRIGKDKIIFDSIYIENASAMILGEGELNLETRTIHMNLAIKVARGLGKLVGSIPLLGYILMGENKSITVGLKITGTIDKPVVTTSSVKDILLLPLNILKRTLKSPAKLLNR